MAGTRLFKIATIVSRDSRINSQRRPRERGDPYAAASRFGTVAGGLRFNGRRSPGRRPKLLRVHQTHLDLPAARDARVVHELSAPIKQRAWGMPGARRTRSLVCAWGSEYAHEYSQRVRRDHPASPRNGLRLMARSPRRSGSFASVAGGITSTNLTPASRRQDHTSSPSVSAPFVIGASTSTASRPASVTIASRPSKWDGTAGNTPVIWVR